jgi:hypothetical protein
MSERFALPTLRQAYIAVPSAPNTPGFGSMDEREHATPTMSGKSTTNSFLMAERKDTKGALHSDSENWPSSPLPPEVVRENLVCPCCLNPSEQDV